jgi:hypothetical protein
MALHEHFALDVHDLLQEDPGHWDRMIAADLAAERKDLLGEEPCGIPEIRRFLAVKGLRALKAYLQEAVAGKTGEAAVRAVIHGMRDFAHLRPGISAATFRSAMTDSPEWRRAAADLADWLATLLADIGLTASSGQDALRLIRAFVRGFVIHEMQGSFIDNADLDDSFAFGVEILLRGLKGGEIATTPRSDSRRGSDAAGNA